MKPLFNNEELATEIAISGKMLLVNGRDARNVCTVLHVIPASTVTLQLLYIYFLLWFLCIISGVSVLGPQRIA